MHAERDHLVKVVFPELRERMARRRLHLVDVDLRWGITEGEAEQGKVLDIVLDEIDRSRPFFIGILGERYGSILAMVPEGAEFAHPWLAEYEGYSFTALEIVHGVLRNPELAQRSFFYFRDPHFISRVPASKRAHYTAESPEAAGKLAALKDEIRASGRPVMENYPCRWHDREGRIVDLDTFGGRVLEDLWTAICAEYPEEAPEVDPLTIERHLHEAFAEDRSRLHVGRLAEAARLTEYVQGTDRRPIVITGESGCGKSAFLANWCRQYAAKNPNDFVLAYFIGASPDSTNHLRLLRNMCEELKRRFGLKEEVPQDDKELPETLGVLLVSASRGDRGGASSQDHLPSLTAAPPKIRRIVLVLDALDQLSAQGGAHGLGWLLDYIPEKVRLVVSSLEKGACLDVLRRRKAEEIALPPLSVDEQRQIVQTLLGEWGRKLDEGQMAALLAHPGGKNPLYLRVALEELRLFGKFEELTRRIEELAHDVAGLFDQVLARLEEDHGRELVAEVFALLGCSRYGLSEAEMLDLLRPEREEQLPRALWARLARGAKAYLVQRGELIGFFHRQLGDAIAMRYLSRENKHSKLAAYFEQAPIERRVDEYPYQLQHAERWQALAVALSDLDFFDYAWKHNRQYEWMGYWRSLEGRFEPGSCYQAAIDDREWTEDEYAAAGRLLHNISLLLKDMTLYSSATQFEERALSMLQLALGPDHPDIAASLINLAMLHFGSDTVGRAAALNLLARALEIREHVFGADHPGVAEILGNMALIYEARENYVDALPLYQHAFHISYHAHALNPYDPRIARSLNGMARLFTRSGMPGEALRSLQGAIKVQERALSPDHPDLAQTLHNMAVLWRDQGDYAEALPLFERALAIRERVLGPNHPDVAQTLRDVGVLHQDRGDYAQALPLFSRALAIRERALGPDHEKVWEVLRDLMVVYRKQGRHVRALHAFLCTMKILVGFVRTLVGYWGFLPVGAGVVCILFSGLLNLVWLFMCGSILIALSVWATPFQRRDVIGIGMSMCLVGVLRLTGVFNTLAGKWGGLIAFSVFEVSLGTYMMRMWWNHYSEVFREVAVADRRFEALYPRGPYKRHSALAIVERAVGPDHPAVANCLHLMGDVYAAQGKYAKAVALSERALTIRERALGADHADVGKSLNNLALLYFDQGKYGEALPLFERAVRIAETAHGAEDPPTEQYRTNLKACHEARRPATSPGRAEPSEGMVVELRALGWAFMLAGIIRIVVSGFMNPVLDMVLICTGGYALLTRRPSTFILIGVVACLVGILNLVEQSTALGVVLLLAGIWVITRFWNWKSA